jgi:Xaa-Pro aminopeptidase
MSHRISRIQEAMHRYGFDALAIVPGSNLRYLSGITLHAGLRLTLALTPVSGQPALGGSGAGACTHCRDDRRTVSLLSLERRRRTGTGAGARDA